eukprot:CAMPEP_0180580498 /NCGR_PEP_ID=MMETSP1037_2-20121125/13554_1 /TAXON_ID=632150 /ORGANISM="Azadinium spinosum, Strain 3D9" /LENGTH=128 /DNA_ID=CAMNT_0022598425 /DNA_START=276 /DNA_END=662 /DNA_ORIENTATION=-
MECGVVLAELRKRRLRWGAVEPRAVQSHISLLEADHLVPLHAWEIHPLQLVEVDIRIEAILLDPDALEREIYFMYIGVCKRALVEDGQVVVHNWRVGDVAPELQEDDAPLPARSRRPARMRDPPGIHP